MPIVPKPGQLSSTEARSRYSTVNEGIPTAYRGPRFAGINITTGAQRVRETNMLRRANRAAGLVETDEERVEKTTRRMTARAKNTPVVLPPRIEQFYTDRAPATEGEQAEAVPRARSHDVYVPDLTDEEKAEREALRQAQFDLQNGSRQAPTAIPGFDPQLGGADPTVGVYMSDYIQGVWRLRAQEWTRRRLEASKSLSFVGLASSNNNLGAVTGTAIIPSSDDADEGGGGSGDGEDRNIYRFNYDELNAMDPLLLTREQLEAKWAYECRQRTKEASGDGDRLDSSTREKSAVLYGAATSYGNLPSCVSGRSHTSGATGASGGARLYFNPFSTRAADRRRKISDSDADSAGENPTSDSYLIEVHAHDSSGRPRFLSVSSAGEDELSGSAPGAGPHPKAASRSELLSDAQSARPLTLAFMLPGEKVLHRKDSVGGSSYVSLYSLNSMRVPPTRHPKESSVANTIVPSTGVRRPSAFGIPHFDLCASSDLYDLVSTRKQPASSSAGDSTPRSGLPVGAAARDDGIAGSILQKPSGRFARETVASVAGEPQRRLSTVDGVESPCRGQKRKGSKPTASDPLSPSAAQTVDTGDISVVAMSLEKEEGVAPTHRMRSIAVGRGSISDNRGGGDHDDAPAEGGGVVQKKPKTRMLVFPRLPKDGLDAVAGGRRRPERRLRQMTAMPKTNKDGEAGPEVGEGERPRETADKNSKNNSTARPVTAPIEKYAN